MLKLSRVGSHEWEFLYPKIFNQLTEEFNRGCESFEEGNLLEAEKSFKSVLAQMPDHLDALHHLAMVQSEQGLVKQARDLWEQSMRIGRKAFPPEFERGQDQLEWGWLDNRPFLRCLHGLALVKYRDGEVEGALQFFQELLSLNPNDNQGVRALAAEALFKLGKFEETIKLTDKYRDDIMPETLYGRAIAFFKLGRRKEATAALNKAIKYLPLVGKELLKKRHKLPKTAMLDRVTVGGADEAYYYWEHWGQFWEDDPDVFEWLKGNLRSKELKNTDRG
jgi:tetratricopeptide (TPR) repeat protein